MTGHEIEVKLRCSGIAVFEEAGITLELELPRHFEENLLFDTPDQRLASRLSVLRVRAAAGSGTLTFKAPPLPGDAASRFKKRVEIETSLADPEQMIAILTRLGYMKWFRYQKYRSVYRAYLPAGETLMVMHDETPIGDFVELEGEEGAIQKAVELLGAGPDQYILLSYIALQAEHCRQVGKPFEDLVFR